jgi:hypothetical protein
MPQMDKKRNWKLIVIGLATTLLPTTCLFLRLNVLFVIPLVVGLGCIVVGILKMSKTHQPRITKGGLIFCLLAAISPFALATYANRTGSPIKIVLPVGFHGEFSIEKDRAHGQSLKRQDGVWLFEIPANGVLIVNNQKPFFMWHDETVIYSDGRAVQVQSLGVWAGSIPTENGAKGSTDYDGTSIRWKTVDTP